MLWGPPRLRRAVISPPPWGGGPSQPPPGVAVLNLAELSLHAYPHTLKNMGGPHT